MQPNDAYFNARVAVPVPAGRSKEDICRAVADCMSTHESLRTLYPVSTDGRISQLVKKSGEISVAVAEFDGKHIESFLEELGGNSFQHESELPVRIAIATQKGLPSHILVVGSHISLDGVGKELLRRDLEARLAGRRPGAEDIHPITSADRAIAEQSPEGQAHNSAVIARWRGLLDRYDVTSFPVAHRTDIDPRWHVSNMFSPALGLGAERIAQRCRVTTSAVYMAASAVMIAALSGRKTVVVKNMISNRFSAAEKEFVGNLAQACATAVEVGESDFDSLVAKTMIASIRGYSMGRYECEDLYRLAEPHRFDSFYNHLRSLDGVRRRAPIGVDDVLALKSATAVGPPEPLTVHGSKLYIEIRDGDAGPEASLITDGWYVPAAKPDRLLLAMAEFVIDVATTEPVAPAVHRFCEALVRNEP
jgi:hypothetical protein